MPRFVDFAQPDMVAFLMQLAADCGTDLDAASRQIPNFNARDLLARMSNRCYQMGCGMIAWENSPMFEPVSRAAGGRFHHAQATPTQADAVAQPQYPPPQPQGPVPGQPLPPMPQPRADGTIPPHPVPATAPPYHPAMPPPPAVQPIQPAPAGTPTQAPPPGPAPAPATPQPMPQHPVQPTPAPPAPPMMPGSA